MRPSRLLSLILSVALIAPATAFAHPKPKPPPKKRVDDIPPSRPGKGNPELARALKLYEQLEFEQALAALKAAAAWPNSTSAEKVQISLYTGIVAGQLGDNALAEQSFTAALKADPNVKLPEDASPKIQSQFRYLREKLYTPAVRPKLTAVAKAIPGVTEVPLEVTGAVGAASVTAFSRSVAAGAWVPTELKPNGEGRYEGRIAGPPETAEFYVEASDAEGVVVARSGSREVPLREAVLPRPGGDLVGGPRPGDETPVYKKWWFWTGVGVVAAGIAGGTYYALKGKPQPCSPNGGGCLEVTVQ